MTSENRCTRAVGHVIHRARYYNTANGRFNQRDSFAGNNFDPQSLQKYAYANCDPVSKIDPSGQFTMVDLLVVVGTIALLGAMLLPGLTKQKQSATATILRSYAKSDFQYEVERGRVNADADFLGVDQEEQQWMFEMANRDGNWERQTELATAGNQILTANAVQTVVTANDVFAVGLGVAGLFAKGEAAADIVYRVIRNDENPALGLFARNPSATYPPEAHIINGSKLDWASQYISTTRDPAVAQFWADKHGCRIVGD